MALHSSGWLAPMSATQMGGATSCRRFISHSGEASLDLTGDARCGLGCTGWPHNTATSKTLRPRASAPTFVALKDSLESLPDAAGSEERLHRRLALDRVYELIQRLGPLDRQVILLYLEALDAKSIGDITGLSAMNVATKIGRLKRILASWFHEGGRSAE